jgi:hypothetical protein
MIIPASEGSAPATKTIWILQSVSAKHLRKTSLTFDVQPTHLAIGRAVAFIAACQNPSAKVWLFTGR